MTPSNLLYYSQAAPIITSKINRTRINAKPPTNPVAGAAGAGAPVIQPAICKTSFNFWYSLIYALNGNLLMKQSNLGVFPRYY